MLLLIALQFAIGRSQQNVPETGETWCPQDYHLEIHEPDREHGDICRHPTTGDIKCPHTENTWKQELDQCFGLTKDESAETKYQCKENCEKNTGCTAWQWYSTVCWSGWTTGCKETSMVATAGAKRYGCTKTDGLPYCIFDGMKYLPNQADTNVCRVEGSEWYTRHLMPEENRAFVLFSRKFKQAKWKRQTSDFTMQVSEAYALDTLMLLTLEKSPRDPTKWLIMAVGASKDDPNGGGPYRIRCGDKGRLWPHYPDTTVTDRDEWTIYQDPVHAGYVKFSNVGRLKWKIAVYKLNGKVYGGCMPYPMNCQSDKIEGCFGQEPNTYGKHSFICGNPPYSYVDKCWGPMSCMDCYGSGSNYVGCCAMPHDNYDSFDESFRMEDVFLTKAKWNSATVIQNELYYAIDHEYVLSKGVTTSIMNSVAKTHSTTESMGLTLEGAFKGIGISADASVSITNEFTRTAQDTTTDSVISTWKYVMQIPPKSCVKLLNLLTDTEDQLTSKPITYYAERAKVVKCEDGDMPQCTISEHHPDCDEEFMTGYKRSLREPLEPSVQAQSTDAEDEVLGWPDELLEKAFSKPLLATSTKADTLDMENHMKESDTDAEFTKEEKEDAGVFMTTTSATSFDNKDLAVYGFATIGVVYLVYGAGKFYFGKNAEQDYSTIEMNI